MSTNDYWNLKMVNAERACRLLPRLSDGKTVDWNEVEVVLIDTGIQKNPVFGDWSSGKTPPTILLDRGRNFKERDKPPLDPMDYRDPMDPLRYNPGHGTRVGSVICGYEKNKYLGVAPGLPLVPYRAVNGVILDENRPATVGEALNHAVLSGRCEVISMSLGYPRGSPNIAIPLNEAYKRGIIVVAAGGQVWGDVVFPARYKRAIAVGGVNKHSFLYHRYTPGQNKHIDVWAPAETVPLATTERARTSRNHFDHKYIEDSGTSFATAHVAAAAAMWLVYRREELCRRYPQPWQRIEAFRALLKATGKKLAYRDPPKTKARILDIEALLKEPLPSRANLKKRKA